MALYIQVPAAITAPPTIITPAAVMTTSPTPGIHQVPATKATAERVYGI